MLGLESLGTNGQALADVGTVFVAAIALYVVYGVVTTAVGGPVKRALGGE